jgi:hypothetical protein
VRVFTLPGGFRLLVGRDTEERDRLRAVIGRAFVTSLAASPRASTRCWSASAS